MQKLPANIINKLDELSMFRSLLDVDMIWHNIVRINLVRELSTIGVSLAFVMFCAALLQSFYRTGSFRMTEHYGLYLRTVLVMLFFGVLYSSVTSQFIVNVAVALNEQLAGEALREFRSQLRGLLFTYQALPEDVGFVRKALRFIGNILTLVTFSTSPIIPVMLVILMQMLIAFIFLIMSIGPFFLVVALLMGPICMALSIAYPYIGYSWLRFLMSAIFFSLIVSIGIITISTTGTVVMATEYVGSSQQFMAIVMVLFVLVFLSMVPFVIAQLFMVRVYSFLGTILGWFWGLSVVFAPVMYLTTALKYTVDANIGSIGRSGGLSRDQQLLLENRNRQ